MAGSRNNLLEIARVREGRGCSNAVLLLQLDIAVYFGLKFVAAAVDVAVRREWIWATVQAEAIFVVLQTLNKTVACLFDCCAIDNARGNQ